MGLFGKKKSDSSAGPSHTDASSTGGYGTGNLAAQHQDGAQAGGSALSAAGTNTNHGVQSAQAMGGSSSAVEHQDGASAGGGSGSLSSAGITSNYGIQSAQAMGANTLASTHRDGSTAGGGSGNAWSSGLHTDVSSTGGYGVATPAAEHRDGASAGGGSTTSPVNLWDKATPTVSTAPSADHRDGASAGGGSTTASSSAGSTGPAQTDASSAGGYGGVSMGDDIPASQSATGNDVYIPEDPYTHQGSDGGATMPPGAPGAWNESGDITNPLGTLAPDPNANTSGGRASLDV
jgi:hypothetical protein